jgi:hypothetical protein
VKNVGATAPFVGGMISLSCTDSGVTSVVPAARTFSTIAAGAVEQSDNSFSVYYDPAKIQGPFALHFSIGLNGHACWDTTLLLTVTRVANEKRIPLAYALEQNYPNPFNPVTVIKYTIGGGRAQGLGLSGVSLVVYDLLGREAAVLVNEREAPGEYEVQFDASNLSSGVYYYRLTAGDFSQTRNMLLVK